MIDERDLALATEHPRGTERRTLLPYRDALQSPEAYAALPEHDRDVIVRWAEIRRLIRARGVDRDPANLADPLIAADRLRRLVIDGERVAAGFSGAGVGSESVIEAVAAIRSARN